MSLAPRSRLVNPLLGNYFGIFASLLTAVFLMLMLLEQLGMADQSVRRWMGIGTFSLYAAIGLASFTRQPSEYFASGRRVPALFNGLIIACAALGGVGLAGIGGSLFIVGFDALCLGIGLVGGLVCLAVLIMPYLRKFGSYSVAGYLGRRFESSTVRVVAATLLAVPMLLLMMAELKLASGIAAWLTQLPEVLVSWMLIVSFALILLPGGMRSLSWTSAAAAIAMLGALFVPVVIVAVMTTYLPLPQMTHGPVLRALMRLEAAQGISAPIAPMLQFDLPGVAAEPVLHRFATPFSSVGSMAFVLAALAVMIGTAGSPALLARAGTSPGVYDTRKSLGWAAAVLGVVLMTLSADAVFLRDMVMNQLVGSIERPDWFTTLTKLGLADVDERALAGTLSSFLFKRDSVLLALPVGTGGPPILVYLAAVGILSAAMAAACAAMAAIGTMLAEDVMDATRGEQGVSQLRVVRARLAIALVAAIGGWVLTFTPGDPLELLLWSLALSGSTAFPVVLLSIWWKRSNAWGAIAGLGCGFAVAILAIMAGEVASIGLPGPLVGVVAAPVAAASMIAVSLMTPVPGRQMLEMVRELRIPGGETFYDREARLAHLRQQSRS